jgi:CDP-diglyceride synthetase
MNFKSAPKLIFRIRLMIGIFVLLLILSGVTAFPVYSEMQWLMDKNIFPPGTILGDWLTKVWNGIREMGDKHGFLFYGYDWLAFAHIVIAMAFIGPLKDPVRNKWVIDWAILSCLAVLPLAFIAGPIRGIPWFHILIDCAFGIIGLFPLFVLKKWINELEIQQNTNKAVLPFMNENQ